MSTYVMSDLHGCWDEFQRMLGLVEYGRDDRLILAGDLIERGPQDMEMLQWIEHCPENVLLLKGNHEEEFAQNIDLMVQVCRKLELDPENADDALTICHTLESVSAYFDYYGSIRELVQGHAVTLTDLRRWAALFRTWPCEHRMTIDGRLFVIVHAGCIEDLNDLPGKYYSDIREFNLYAREDAYLYGGIEHAVVIAGHTPTIIRSSCVYNAGRVFRHYNKRKDCTYYDIDCGAVFRNHGAPEARLACIRLEDESIFYI